MTDEERNYLFYQLNKISQNLIEIDEQRKQIENLAIKSDDFLATQALERLKKIAKSKRRISGIIARTECAISPNMEDEWTK